MFCKKCGKEIKEGSAFCANCGTAVTQNTTADVSKQPAAHGDASVLIDAERAPAGKKFSARKLIAPIAAVAAVAVIAVTAALNWGAITSLFSRETGEPSTSPTVETGKPEMTDEEYLMMVEKESYGGYVDALSQSYGRLISTGSTESIVDADLDLTLNMGEPLLAMLEQSYTAETGEEMDFSWLSEICLELDVDTQEALQQVSMGMSLADQRILTLSIIQNMSDQMVWLGIPEISSKFLEMDMQAMGYPASSYDQLEGQQAFLQSLPSEDQMNEMLTRYADIMLSHLNEVERTTETLALDGLEQSCTVLTVKIYEKDAREIAVDILETAKSDAELKQIIDGYSDYYNDMMRAEYENYGMEWVDEDYYSAFLAAIDDALETLEQDEELDTESYIALSTYVDDTDAVIGRRFRFVGDDPVDAGFYTVTQGDVTNFTVFVEPLALEVTGSSTVREGVQDAEMTVYVDETAYLLLEVEDFDLEKQSQGVLSGTVRLEPSSAMLDEMFGDASGMALMDVALELEFISDAGTSGIRLDLLVNDTFMFGISATAGTSESDTIEVPTETVDMMDAQELEEWITEMDFSTLLDQLRRAGVQQSFVSMLEDALESFRDSVLGTGSGAVEDDPYGGY